MSRSLADLTREAIELPPANAWNWQVYFWTAFRPIVNRSPLRSSKAAPRRSNPARRSRSHRINSTRTLLVCVNRSEFIEDGALNGNQTRARKFKDERNSVFSYAIKDCLTKWSDLNFTDPVAVRNLYLVPGNPIPRKLRALLLWPTPPTVRAWSYQSRHCDIPAACCAGSAG
jgi:hypothetical protein